MAYIYVPDAEQNLEEGRPSVRLIGTDGNVFNLLGLCSKAMKDYHKVDPKYNAELMFNELCDEVKQGDYNNALRVIMAYCDVS